MHEASVGGLPSGISSSSPPHHDTNLLLVLAKTFKFRCRCHRALLFIDTTLRAPYQIAGAPRSLLTLTKCRFIEHPQGSDQQQKPVFSLLLRFGAAIPKAAFALAIKSLYTNAKPPITNTPYITVSMTGRPRLMNETQDAPTLMNLNDVSPSLFSSASPPSHPLTSTLFFPDFFRFFLT
ncbi:hypothetical protein Moror_2454 [Moniliophthora roreri MCA 2997]|uniref:Uncharacterized protein n=1 Tax=Moniliophthora roreri (strain MCA 2997) TaxID=1381753 RepID=V2WZZ0_MONRO|nr:hypothetical protein Moror_2454 [Moniliophthora roreri MCA 2997]